MRDNATTILHGSRVRLVPYLPAHIATYHSWMQDEELLALTCSEPLTLEEETANQRSWCEDPRKVTFIVCDASNSNGSVTSGMCGDVNAFLYDADTDDDEEAATPPQRLSAELEVMIADASKRRCGLAREALLLLIHWLLEHVENIDYLVAKITDENKASLKLFESLGFTIHKHLAVFGQTELRMGVHAARAKSEVHWHEVGARELRLEDQTASTVAAAAVEAEGGCKSSSSGEPSWVDEQFAVHKEYVAQMASLLPDEDDESRYATSVEEDDEEPPPSWMPRLETIEGSPPAKSSSGGGTGLSGGSSSTSMPTKHPYAISLRESLARLSLMHDDVLSMAMEMRCIYPAETIHKHLVQKASKVNATVCWEVGDLAAYLLDTSPEPLLPARRSVQRPPDEVLAELPDLLTRMTQTSGCMMEDTFVTRDNQLRLAKRGENDEVGKWLAELGECADPRCGCFRQTQPKARQAFREALLSRVSRARRYVTVGSGGLLYDLELLLSLQQLFGGNSGIELIVAIDKKYCFDGSAVLRLGSLLPESTDVHAFSHIDSYVDQATKHPETFGKADVYVQCDVDVNDVSDEKALEAAKAALAPGGVALMMRGDGAMFELGGDGQWQPVPSDLSAVGGLVSFLSTLILAEEDSAPAPASVSIE